MQDGVNRVAPLCTWTRPRCRISSKLSRRLRELLTVCEDAILPAMISLTILTMCQTEEVRLSASVTANGRRYPGETSTSAELIALADEFRRAADAVVLTCTRGSMISTAPFRLLCIHAIELYLNAFLRDAGQPAPAIRGLQHNLAARLELTDRYGLVLRQKTRGHLAAVSENREYLISRYEPDAAKLSQLNRLQATLAEVREKVLKKLSEPKPKNSARALTSVGVAASELRT